MPGVRLGPAGACRRMCTGGDHRHVCVDVGASHRKPRRRFEWHRCGHPIGRHLADACGSAVRRRRVVVRPWLPLPSRTPGARSRLCGVRFRAHPARRRTGAGVRVVAGRRPLPAPVAPHLGRRSLRSHPGFTRNPGRVDHRECCRGTSLSRDGIGMGALRTPTRRQANRGMPGAACLDVALNNCGMTISGRQLAGTTALIGTTNDRRCYHLYSVRRCSWSSAAAF